MERIVKNTFIVILVINLLIIHFEKSIYPSIRFPIFKNEVKDSIFYQNVQLYSVKTKKQVDFFNIIKPYDKYYYLAVFRELSAKRNETQIMKYINFLSKNDSLNFCHR